MYQQRRRKKRHTHGLRTVEVMRGRSGYGFTISSQHPCILSCIVTGSPADRAGLKMGDFLIAVNSLNVSKSSHDDVVRLVGSSSGLLVLQIAENYNSSDSSDDEFQNSRPKSKYPNRTRRREAKDKSPEDSYAQAPRSGGTRHSGHKKDIYDQIRARALSPGRQLEQKYLKQSRSRGSENVNPHVGLMGGVTKKAKHVSSNDGIIRYRSPNTKHTIITREARLGIQKAHGTPEGSFLTPVDPPPKAPLASADNRLSGGYHHPYVHPHIAQQRHHSASSGSSVPASPCLPEQAPSADEDVYVGEDMRIVVGYAGSVEMPRDAKLANSRLQSIRGAVRRLRVEQKIHTLVLMEVSGEGVKLVNSMSCTVAQYPAIRVAFCGVCPDDTRFFGVVTLHTAATRESDELAVREEGLTGSSCHVFMVDPELAPHSAHVGKARNFGFHCTVHTDTQRCLQFPMSATPVVQCIARLYRERQAMLGDAELAQIGAFAGPNFAQNHRRRQHSTSSNSDSGLGVPPGREGLGGSEKVCVVEMPLEEVDTSLRSHGGESSADNSVYVTPSSSLASSMYSSRDVSSILLSTGERVVPGSAEPSSGLSTTMDTTSSSLNQSGAPGSATSDRLNIRAMPNPRGYNMSGSFGDLLEQQNSADNLRKSMHRMLRTRQKGPDNPSGSDAESVRSESSQGNPAFSAPAPSVIQTPGQVPPPLPPRNSHMTQSNPSLSTSSLKQPNMSEPPPKRPSSPKGAESRPPHSQPSTPSQIESTRERMPTPNVKATPKTQVMHTPIIKQLTAQTPGGTRLSGFGAMSDTISAFSRTAPAISASKPPLPVRRPFATRAGPKTPVPTPHAERPKSTPPFRVFTPGVGGDVNDYDSDPCELSSYGGSLMDVNVDDWTEHVSELKTPASKHSLFSRRRRSDGFGIFKPADPKSNTKSAASKLFSLGKKNKHTVVSTSHESLVVSDAEFPKNKLNGATSAVAINGPRQTVQNGSICTSVGRAAGWAVNFEKLLTDKAGLATFTEFLKKEYSEENIIFWSLCEKYKKIKTDGLRVRKAREIFNAHLAANAPDPVNVDSESRKAAEAGLANPTPELFKVPQIHIFKLMKQDSYVRFLKSDLYKDCVVGEVEGRPLPHSQVEDEEWEEDAPNRDKMTLKKNRSTPNAEEGDEKRRKSLLPWNRTKSEKKLVKQNSESDLKRNGAVEKGMSGMRVDVSPTADLPDLNLMRKEMQTSIEKPSGSVGSHVKPPLAPPARPDVGTQDGVMKENQKFCRVILPDKSTTVIYAKPGQSIKTGLHKLCERRGINTALVEVTQVGQDKLIDIESDISLVGSKEIVLERVIVFRLDLPHKKTVAVKARPAAHIRDTFRPILAKYGLKLDSNLVVHVAGTGVILNDDAECKTLDGKQVVIQSLDDFKEWGSFGGSHRSLYGKPPIPRGRGDPSPVRQSAPASLDDVLSGLFKDFSDRVTMSSFDENGVFDPDKKEKKSDDNRNSGLFGFIRRNSVGDKEGKRLKTKTPAVFSSQRPAPEVKKPTESRKPPLPRQGGGLDRDGEKFLDLLTRTSRQIDDQRGPLKDLELPDFLKVDKAKTGPILSRASRGATPDAAPRPRLRKNIISDSHLMRKLENGPSVSKTMPVSRSHEKLSVPARPDMDKSAQSIQSLGTPMSQSLKFQDISFSQDGVLPTHGEAENYFFNPLTSRSAVNFNDSLLMDGNLQDIGFGSGSAHKSQISFGTFKGQPFQSATPNKAGAEPKPVPMPRHSRPAVPQRKNPPKRADVDMPASGGASPQSSSSELDTLLPPSSDSSEADLPPSWDDMSPPTPRARVNQQNGAPGNFCATQQYSHGQYSPYAAHFSDSHTLPHRPSARPIVAESDIEYEMTGSAAFAGLEREFSTPSPTTHDLVLETGSSTDGEATPKPPARASIIKKKQEAQSGSGQKAKKTLIFDTKEASGDMQVSFV